jgi:hypothetical protein
MIGRFFDKTALCSLLLMAFCLPTQAQNKPTIGAETAKPGQTATTPKPEAGGGVAGTVQIRKELPGEYLYRFVPKSGTSTSPASLPAASPETKLVPLNLPSGMKPTETMLEVIDLKKGLLSRLPVKTSGETALTESSFQWAQAVTIPVQSDGKPVSGVQVSLTSKDGKYREERLLQEADRGEAKFENVPLGAPMTATVKFGSNPEKSQTQTLTRDSHNWGAIDVKDWQGVITGPAPAVSASSGTPSAAGSTQPPPPVYRPESGYSSDRARPAESSGGGLGNIVSTLLSLAFLAACAYGLYWAYNTGRMKTMLDKLGIQIAPVAATEPAPNPFKQERTPVQPITEGTADPFGGAGGALGVAAPVPMSAGPRLVGTVGVYSGQIFPLSGASVDIGRDTANAIPLPQDTNASRKHAIIQVAGGQCLVLDNGSSNGTFVNGVRIANQTPQPLRPGDELTVGNTRFRFEA